MIIVMDINATANQVKHVIENIDKRDLTPVIIEGQSRDVIGITGDTTKISMRDLEATDGVSEVIRVSAPYKLANRAFHPQDSHIQVRDRIVGGQELAIIAGPCSVEGEEEIISSAKRMKAAGANMLRGGAFKPRTSPYSFQGLEMEGIKMLVKAREETGLPIVTELMSKDYVDEFAEHVDVIQIGARNMQNYDLLKAVGRTQTPVLLKRGMCSTYEEWLMAAEYIMSEGNPNVMLCERGIRTFETETRNCLDIQAVPVLNKLSHLPVIIDPSHAAGTREYIAASSRAAVAAGADGLIIETHPCPEDAWSDGAQSLTPDEFDQLMEEVTKIAQAMDRTLPEVQ